MAERTPHPATNGAADAVAMWQEKLEFLLEKEAILSDPAQQFTVQKQIEEAEEKIRELAVAPPPSPPPRDPESERQTRCLKQLYARKKKLALACTDVTAVTNEILDVRRMVRRGRASVRALRQRGASPLQAYVLRPVVDRNCVAARRGGEQQETSNQSVGDERDSAYT